MEIEGLIVVCCSDFMQVFFILKRLLAFELEKVYTGLNHYNLYLLSISDVQNA